MSLRRPAAAARARARVRVSATGSATALALVLAGCGGGGTPASAPRPCPEQVEVQDAAAVPQVDVALEGTPTAATVCDYDGDGALQGQRPLSGDLAPLAQALRLPTAFPGQAPACPPDPSARPLLLVLTTAAGPVQLGSADDPAECAPTLLGTRASAVHVGDLLAASAAAGRVTEPDDPDAGQRCGPGRPGRAGQEGALLPGEPVRATVCTTSGSGVRREQLAPERLEALVDLLDEPVAVPSTPAAACPQRREVLADYAEGPPVLLTVGCGRVDNGSLVADVDPSGLEAVLR